MPLSPHLNTFAGNPLDRVSERRREPEWLADQLETDATTVLAFWNGLTLVRDSDRGPHLARIGPGLAVELGGGDERLLFMGLDEQGRAVFALDLEGGADPAEGLLQGCGRFANLRDLAPILPAGDCGMAASAKAVFEWRRRHRFCSACGQPTHVAEAG